VGFEEKERIGSFVESFVMRLSLSKDQKLRHFLHARAHAHAHTFKTKRKKMQSIIAHQRYQATAGVEVRPLLSLFPLRFGLITLFFYFWIYIFSLRLMMIFAQRSVRSTDDVMRFLSLSVSHRRLRRVYYIGSDFRSSARAPTLAKRSRKREP